MLKICLSHERTNNNVKLYQMDFRKDSFDMCFEEIKF